MRGQADFSKAKKSRLTIHTLPIFMRVKDNNDINIKI